MPLSPVLNRSWGAGHRARHSGAGEDLANAALPVQTGAAIRPAQLFHPTGVLANGTIERIAATGEGVALDRLLLAARLAAAGVDLSGSAADFFLVDFVPLLSRADDVVLMAMKVWS